MWLNYENVKLLAKFRDDILITSLYDATIASAMKLSPTQNLAPNQHQNNKKPEIGMKIEEGKRFAKEQIGAQNKAPQIKQIGNLFDPDVLGREMDNDNYGLCHYCKQIKPIKDMVKCNYKSTKVDFQSGKTINSSGIYKGN